ncbi:MAG TPA: hypothetical protein VFW10_07475 [Steroidobacteraceae bacterium]|nr:hypothetical protein [Steroidobacteraceae bacterium]
MTNDNAERFERLLIALERDLIEASDEEILEAARDLRMNPEMRGSAAFIGLLHAPRWPREPDAPSESSGTPRARRKPEEEPP